MRLAGRSFYVYPVSDRRVKIVNEMLGMEFKAAITFGSGIW